MFCRYCGSIVRSDRCKKCGGVPVDPSMRVGAVTNDRKDPWISGSIRSRRDRRSQSMIFPPDILSTDNSAYNSNPNINNDINSFNKNSSAYLRSIPSIFNERDCNSPVSSNFNLRLSTPKEKFPEIVSPIYSRSLIPQRNQSRQSQYKITPTHKISANEFPRPVSSKNNLDISLYSQKFESDPLSKVNQLQTADSSTKSFKEATTLLYNNGMSVNNDTASPLRRQNRISSFSFALQKMKAMDSANQSPAISKSDLLSTNSFPFNNLPNGDNLKSNNNMISKHTPSTLNTHYSPSVSRIGSPLQKNKRLSYSISDLNLSKNYPINNQPAVKAPEANSSVPLNKFLREKNTQSTTNPIPFPRNINEKSLLSAEQNHNFDIIKKFNTPETKPLTLDVNMTPAKVNSHINPSFSAPSNQHFKSKVQPDLVSVTPVKKDKYIRTSSLSSRDSNNFKFIEIANSLKNCSVCSKIVKFQEQRQFSSKPGVMFCQECYYKEYTRGQCYICNKTVLTYGRPWVSFEDKVFHKLCLLCCDCNSLISETPEILDNGKVACSKCFKLNMFEKLDKTIQNIPKPSLNKTEYNKPKNLVPPLKKSSLDNIKPQININSYEKITAANPNHSLIPNLSNASNSFKKNESVTENTQTEKLFQDKVVSSMEKRSYAKPLPQPSKTLIQKASQKLEKNIEPKTDSKNEPVKFNISKFESATNEPETQKNNQKTLQSDLNTTKKIDESANEIIPANIDSSNQDINSHLDSFVDDIPSVADILDFVAKNSSERVGELENPETINADIPPASEPFSVPNSSAELTLDNSYIVDNKKDTLKYTKEQSDSNKLDKSYGIPLSKESSVSTQSINNFEADYNSFNKLSLNTSTASIENDISILPEYYKNARAVFTSKNESTDFGSSSTINHTENKNKNLTDYNTQEIKSKLFDKSEIACDVSTKIGNSITSNTPGSVENVKESLKKLDQSLSDIKNSSNSSIKSKLDKSNSIKSLIDSFSSMSTSTVNLPQDKIKNDLSSYKYNSKNNISNGFLNEFNSSVKPKNIDQIKKQLNSKLSPSLNNFSVSETINNLPEIKDNHPNANVTTSYNADVTLNTSEIFKSDANAKKMNLDVVNDIVDLRALSDHNIKSELFNINKNNIPQTEIETDTSALSSRRISTPLTIPNILKARPSPRSSPRTSARFIKPTFDQNEKALKNQPSISDNIINQVVPGKIDFQIKDNIENQNLTIELEKSISDVSSISDIGSINNSQDTWFNLNDNRKIHIECFYCPKCENPIDDGIYVIKKGKEYHPGCLPQSPPIISIETIPIKNLKRSTTIKSRKPVAAPRPTATLKSEASHLQKSRASIKSILKRSSANSDELLFSDVDSEYSINLSDTADACDNCGLEILGPRFCLTSGKLYHPECFICTGCNERFEEGSYVSYEGSEYHHHCVPVVIANNTASTDAQNNKNSCLDEYNNSFNNTQNEDDDDTETKLYCYKCQKQIDGVFVDFNEMSFHPDCFNCIDCKKVISPQIPFGDIGENGPCCESCLRNRFPKAINF
ncbi:hypothetical protein BB561_002416 [Smittium simulii]|uniref:LIM zinc-binding domain-containing protein n=1 Tax=Smittium simulii TaxID=133385 RepID=A0A2T9YQJ5_9FUNG|nr:hypothetical protein BB561_002416 [Smittium simulii]